jgi:hypothetical protein
MLEMRIAYITINIDPKIINGGVGNKIKRQISLWRSMGHSVTLFVLTPQIITLSDSQQFVFSHSVKLFPVNLVVREVRRSIMLSRLIAAVRKYQPDAIYLRFGLYTFPLHLVFRVAPVILEVNSNDLDEYRSRILFFYWLNRLTRRILFSNSAGWVVIGNELANAEMNRIYKKPMRVVSNGIDHANYEQLLPPQNHDPYLTMVGSPGMNWHGIDTLFPLAERYPELDINIVGYNHSDFEGPDLSNRHFYGFLDQQGVKEILSRTDVAFGTLALHRKNMQELDPLKVREALSYSIPVIIAY